MFLGPQSRPTLLSRTTALLGVLLVLVLAVLASSPDLHERLHAQAPASAASARHAPSAGDDDGCVVTVFSQGVVLALAALSLAIAALAQAKDVFAVVERIAPRAPRFLQLPSQAPPAS
ncbi:MAG TPA: hypothetical protein VGG37_03355 [Opitutaceae bacterium]|jgi:hypothetical protein